jgi:hypothetical protein
MGPIVVSALKGRIEFRVSFRTRARTETER